MRQEMDQFAKDLDRETYEAVRSASKAKVQQRLDALNGDFDNPDALRKLAKQIKKNVRENLGEYLEQAEAAFQKNGATVHWANDSEEANAAVLDIMRRRGATKMVKAKSMVSEETELVSYLEKYDIEAIETDLGEFIVQIDGDHPSHIVTPIIHKNRRQVGRSFEREGLGEYTEDPQTLTTIARKHLRQKYLDADVGFTGANFLIAETGRIVIVTNEGNARFSIAANKTHIVMVGIEKIIPREKDLPVFLSLLARSATGQALTVYTQFISGPKAVDQPGGPEEMHIIFLDNGRTDVLASECAEILACIRCGACMNVCPVYRQTSGHAYRSIYPGPVGAVLSPLLDKSGFAELADLPKASSLCGACQEVCPVDIAIPDLLLRLRNRGKKEGAKKASVNTPGFGLWAMAATQPAVWKTGLKLGHAMNVVPHAVLNANPSARSWQKTRNLPEFKGGEFRKWLKQSSAQKEGKK